MDQYMMEVGPGQLMSKKKDSKEYKVSVGQVVALHKDKPL
jgi:hypothetical protein